VRIAPALLLVVSVRLSASGPLATTNSGSAVFFSTNQPRRGLGEPAQDRIYSLDSAGVSLRFGGIAEATPAPAIGRTTNFYRFAHPSPGGAAAVAYTAERDCLDPGGCAGLPLREGRIDEGGNTVFTASGAIRLSASGHVALVDSETSPPQLRIVRWRTDEGLRRSLNNRILFAPQGRVISDEGTAVGATADGLLAIINSTSVLTYGVRATNPTINSAGRLIAFTVQEGERCKLRVLRANNLVEVLLAEGVGVCGSAQISADGSRVLFLSDIRFGTGGRFEAPQLQIAFPFDPDQAPIAIPDPSGIRQATLSDDGEVIWYESRGGYLAKIDLLRAAFELSLLGAPSLDLAPGTVLAAGSIARIPGSGLTSQSTSAAAPLPAALGGVRLLLDGTALPLESINGSEVVAQVPWNARSGPAQLRLEAPSNAFFEPAPIPVEIRPRYGRIWDLAPGLKGIVHGNLRGAVTEQDPARPGDFLLIIATGLGPVIDPPLDGAASETASPVRDPVACSTAEGAPVAIPVLGAALAPGTVGLYQLIVQIPAELPGSFTLACGSSAEGEPEFRAFIPLRQ
jgi:uncharacterized protein (TIGR03437 family)